MSLKLKMTDDEIKKVLADVQKAIGTPLAKAVGDAPPEETAPVDAAPPVAPQAAAPAPEAPPAPALDAAAEGKPHDEGQELSEMNQGAEQGSDDGQLDPEMLTQEYASLPDEDLQMHYLCAKKALEAKMGSAGDEGSEEAPAPAPEMGKAEASSGPAKADAKSPEGKSNGPAHGDKAASGAKANGPALADKLTAKAEKSKEESSELSKSEFDSAVSFLKSENENLKNQLGKLAKSLTDYFETPTRKAVTGLKPEENVEKKVTFINPALVSEKLKGKISSLSKADKDLVTGFYDGKVSLSKLAHLLK